MTAWLLLVTAGFSVFSVSGVATEADCNTLAAALQAATPQQLNHSCISYEAASAISEVHVFDRNSPAGDGPRPPGFSFKPKQQPHR
jgi:hypothetical protein